jgi:hypothetical protein
MGAKSGGDRTRPAHKFTRLNDFRDLGALLRNFFAALPARSDAPKGRGRAPGRAVSLWAWTKPKNGQNETLISPSETKRFAGHHEAIEIIIDVESVISRDCLFSMAYPLFRFAVFARLYVLNDLASPPFRRFRGMLFRPPQPGPMDPESASRRAPGRALWRAVSTIRHSTTNFS